MTMRRESNRVRVSRVLWLAAAVFAVGAGPAEPWRAVRPNLPPVTVAPGNPTAPEVSIPRAMPARPSRATMPVVSPTPRAPVAAVPSRQAQLPAAQVYVPNTHVYILDGVDPLGFDGITQMAKQIRASGYPDTHVGGWHQALRFDRQIRQTHRDDPNAQFVIIGYSFGVYRARALANRLSRDGIPVVMVGYIGGDYLQNSPESRQVGNAHMVNVMGDGYLLTGRNWFFNGTELDGADNYRMPGVRHFNLPKQEQTLNMLVNGMNASTSRTWTSTPVVANGAGVPGRILTGPETVKQPVSSTSTYPVYATGRR